MAISPANSIFTFPNSPLNSNPSSHSISNSVKYSRPRISAAYATAERTSTTPETITPGSSSLYDVLGVRIGADTREVKAAYRRLARVLHPDVGNCDSSADEFMKVHSAYTTAFRSGETCGLRSKFVPAEADEGFVEWWRIQDLEMGDGSMLVGIRNLETRSPF